MYGIVTGDNRTLLWGLDPIERAQRIFDRHDIELVGPDHKFKKDDTVIVLSSDFAFEAAFVKKLKSADDVMLDDAAGRTVAAKTRGANLPTLLARMEGKKAPKGAGAKLPPAQPLDDFAVTYQKALRKTNANLVFPFKDTAPWRIEWDLYIGAYKGVTDLFTKYAWPVPAYWLTRVSQSLGLSPNFVTTLSLILVVWACYLFAVGDFGWGLVAGWFMCVLDTVDGKLARVTIRSSKWGEAYDHGIDMLHPPFWYAAWAYGVHHAGLLSESEAWIHFGLIFSGYWLGRIAEGVFMLIAGGLEMWVWRPIDSTFRLIVSRRNPNLAILTAATIMGAPDVGLIGVTTWTIVSVLYQAVRIAWAGVLRMMGRNLGAWVTP